MLSTPSDRSSTALPILRWLAGACLCLLLGSALRAQNTGYFEREIFIPWDAAGPHGLDALLVFYPSPGRHPLVVLTHGSESDPRTLGGVTPWQELPQAVWFARRGWIALVVVRRGYGYSEGDPDTKKEGSSGPWAKYDEAGRYSAEDLHRAIDYIRVFPQVDATHVVVAGVYSGGLAAVALTADAPPGLVAAINFSGGRGNRDTHEVRDPDSLIAAFNTFGKTSHVPMLSLYSENDPYYWPALAHKLDDAFRSGGGQDQFILEPPTEGGQLLFDDIPAWSDAVDHFLAANHLVFVNGLLPGPIPPNVPPPAGLSEEGLKAFREYLLAPRHKAFAMSEHYFASASGWATADGARGAALDNLRQASNHTEKGKLVFVENAPAP